MEFEYKQVRQFEEVIEINDIGQCALELIDSNGLYYYLIIRTILGETVVFDYGPILLDVEVLPKVVNCSFTRIVYDMDRIKKTINTFLAGKKGVVVKYVKEVSIEEVLDSCVDIVEYMRKYIR